MLGHKIYYKIDTGQVIFDRGEMMGNVRETSLSEDLSTYLMLKSTPIENLGVITIEHGQRTAEIANMGSMKVIDGQLVIYPRLTMATNKTSIAVDEVATIAVNTQDECMVEFTADNGAPAQIQTVNKIAILEFSSELTGKYAITASTELYGQGSVTVEVI
jgi:hypothetical protein